MLAICGYVCGIWWNCVVVTVIGDGYFIVCTCNFDRQPAKRFYINEIDDFGLQGQIFAVEFELEINEVWSPESKCKAVSHTSQFLLEQM